MAKSTDFENASPAATLGEQLEQQQQAQEYQKALTKRRNGERLTKNDTEAIDRFQATQARIYGERYMSAMPKKDFMEAVAIQPKTLLEWHRTRDFPYSPRRKTLNAWEILSYFCERFKTNGSSISAGMSQEDVLLFGASDELKGEFIRERIREKRITNAQKAIELELARSQYVPIGPIMEAHNEMADRIRRTRERLTRLFDGEDKDRIEQAFDDLIDDYSNSIEEKFSEKTPTKENDSPPKKKTKAKKSKS